MMLHLTVFSVCVLLTTVNAFEDKTITQWLIDRNFTVLSDLLQTSGLDRDLNGNGPFTIFAPTDDAFRHVPTSIINSLKADLNKLKAVLLYHVVNGFMLGPQIKAGLSKLTLNGESLHFQKFANGTIEVLDAKIIGNEQILNNGVVHVIDEVLLPNTLTLGELLLMNPDFLNLGLLLTITDLMPALYAGPYTLFAPSDAAFDAIATKLPSFASPNAMQVYAELLKGHVVNGTYLSTSLLNGARLTTLHNNVITVSTTGGVSLGPSGARVTKPDIQGVNGVIHVIDKVMVPADLQNLGRR